MLGAAGRLLPPAPDASRLLLSGSQVVAALPRFVREERGLEAAGVPAGKLGPEERFLPQLADAQPALPQKGGTPEGVLK